VNQKHAAGCILRRVALAIIFMSHRRKRRLLISTLRVSLKHSVNLEKSKYWCRKYNRVLC